MSATTYICDVRRPTSACHCCRISPIPLSLPARNHLRPQERMTQSKKVFIRTFGCQMNEYDSDKMADVLAAAEGFEKTSDPAEADLILFNTCSVREKAQEKVFADLGRVKPFKDARPGVLIGVGGCVASQEGEDLVRRAPFVDVVFGPQTLHRLPALIARRREAHLRELRKLIDQHFDLEDMRTLCFDLGLRYDNLRGEDKTAKARELVDLMVRRGRLDELVEMCREERPKVKWPEKKIQHGDTEPRRKQHKGETMERNFRT